MESLPQELKTKIEKKYNALLNQKVNIHESKVNNALTFKGFSVKKVALDKYKIYFVFQTKELIDKDWMIYIHAKVADKNVALLPLHRQLYKSETWDCYPEPPTSQWPKQKDLIVTREINAKPIQYNLEIGFYRPDEVKQYEYFGQPIKLGWIDLGKIE